VVPARGVRGRKQTVMIGRRLRPGAGHGDAPAPDDTGASALPVVPNLAEDPGAVRVPAPGLGGDSTRLAGLSTSGALKVPAATCDQFDPGSR
jgi:hypothetical protein